MIQDDILSVKFNYYFDKVKEVFVISIKQSFDYSFEIINNVPKSIVKVDSNVKLFVVP